MGDELRITLVPKTSKITGNACIHWTITGTRFDVLKWVRRYVGRDEVHRDLKTGVWSCSNYSADNHAVRGILYEILTLDNCGSVDQWCYRAKLIAALMELWD